MWSVMTLLGVVFGGGAGEPGGELLVPDKVVAADLDFVLLGRRRRGRRRRRSRRCRAWAEGGRTSWRFRRRRGCIAAARTLVKASSRRLAAPTAHPASRPRLWAWALRDAPPVDVGIGGSGWAANASRVSARPQAGKCCLFQVIASCNHRASSPVAVQRLYRSATWFSDFPATCDFAVCTAPEVTLR